ncbi:MAG TPA: hypothetical protein VF118_02280, partial [Gemmatimonadaceae bacterium]
AAPISAVPVCFSTERKTGDAAGATWHRAAIARRPRDIAASSPKTGSWSAAENTKAGAALARDTGFGKLVLF